MGGGCVVALDIDGTLIPTLVDFESLRARVRRLLGTDHPLRPLGESLAKLPVSEELREKAWKVVEEAELESTERLDPTEVADNVERVRELASLGVDVVFVTARSSRTASMVLSKLELSSMVKLILSRDVSPYRVEQLRYVLELSRGKSVVFVGDTQYDEEAAKALGVPFVKVESFRELPKALEAAVKMCRVEALSEGNRRL